MFSVQPYRFHSPPLPFQIQDCLDNLLNCNVVAAMPNINLIESFPRLDSVIDIFIKTYLSCMWSPILYNIIILCLEAGSHPVINIIVHNCISFGKTKKAII